MLNKPGQLDELLHSHQSDSRGGWRQPTSAFSYLEEIANCWHVPGWSWRMDYQSCGPGTRGSNLVLWKMITQRSAKDVGFSLTSQVNWARRTVQVEANAAHHCHWSFGIATHGFHKHWDNYGIRPTIKHCECFGLLWSLYKICHGLHDPWPNCMILLLSFYGKDTSYLWSTCQAPEWLRCQFWK